MRTKQAKKRLISIYRRLYAYFGPQHWWPAETPFEVMVGAILTQNTSWLNVEKAIAALKQKRLLSPKKLYKISRVNLASLIRPTGYYNIKAERLKEFLGFLFKRYKADIKRLSLADTAGLRRELLEIKGIGQETADSILLYALGKPVFVIDAYTKRALARHHLIKEGASYEEVQGLFMGSLKPQVRLFNEYHALWVRLGKEFCLKNDRRCEGCPLAGFTDKI
ncbi:MAG: endonuclease III domain-containing protein [Candidatus Omnitrophota bacterium]